MNATFTIPKFRLPGFVAEIGRKLPQWPHAVALVGGLNAALKMKLLPEDGLTALDDKLFRVRVLDTGGEACYTYRDGLFRPVFRPAREPDLAFARGVETLWERALARLGVDPGSVSSSSTGVS